MPSVYDYRHIELDRVGCGKKRIVQPPGGNTSDIFGRSGSRPGSQNTSPSPSSPLSSAPSTPRRGSLARSEVDSVKNILIDTQSPVQNRRVKDHMRSNIFGPPDSVDGIRATPTRKKLPPRRNPITGEIIASDSAAVTPTGSILSIPSASPTGYNNIHHNGSGSTALNRNNGIHHVIRSGSPTSSASPDFDTISDQDSTGKY